MRTASIDESSNWQQLLQHSFHSGAELLEFLQLEPSRVSLLPEDQVDFSCRVPLPYARRMRVGDPDDPLLLQVLPLAAELDKPAGYSLDPLQENSASPQAGVIHKYQGRVLLLTTEACAINCRYCFRRHFPYEAHQPRSQQLEAALEYIARDTSITEVILSGGDPLLLNDRRLAELTAEIEAIAHVQRLRIHTRLPVCLPQRVTSELCGLLENSRLSVVVAIHANHPNELDGAVRVACTLLRDAGVTMLNQTVLLRRVNDDPAVLAQLSEGLFAMAVMPYYLHLLDPVIGAAHFDMPDSEARSIYAGLSARVPGYLLPKLVREEAGCAHKRIMS